MLSEDRGQTRDEAVPESDLGGQHWPGFPTLPLLGLLCSLVRTSSLLWITRSFQPASLFSPTLGHLMQRCPDGDVRLWNGEERRR